MAVNIPITTVLEALRNARWYYEYTSFGAAIDLSTDVNGPADSVNARGIKIVAGAGSVVVRMGRSSTTDITLTVAPGNEFPGDFREIRSVSGVTKILVWW